MVIYIRLYRSQQFCRLTTLAANFVAVLRKVCRLVCSIALCFKPDWTITNEITRYTDVALLVIMAAQWGIAPDRILGTFILLSLKLEIKSGVS